MKDTVKFTASMIIVMLAASGFIYMIYQAGYQAAKNEQQPVIVYQVDGAGVEMFGKFLVTREQYEAIKVGDPIPDYMEKSRRGR